MEIKSIFTDEEAVSPVIGVILMVAITVILAAVIGAFVLGIGGSQEKVPQASFSFTYDSGDSEADVTHEGGDQIDVSNIKISSGGSSASSYGSGDLSDTSDSDWTAGETLYTGVDSGSGGTVQVIWQSPSSDDTNIIGEGTAS